MDAFSTVTLPFSHIPDVDDDVLSRLYTEDVRSTFFDDPNFFDNDSIPRLEYCDHCRSDVCFCRNPALDFPEPWRPRFGPATPATIAAPSSSSTTRNEASLSRPQEMESSGAGALASQAASLPDNPYTQPQPNFEQVTVNDPTNMAFTDYSFPDQANNLDSISTPVHNPSISHFHASHMRESIGEQHVSSPTSNDAANAANILANGATFDPFNVNIADFDPADGDIYQQYIGQLDSMVDPFEPDPSQEELLDGSTVDSQRENMRAYAKIVLPDGDFYVTSQKVIVGRDMDCFKAYQREQKKAERRAEQAQQALDDYKLEPSMPSQPDEGDIPADPSSRSNGSLEGRPARGLPSNYSEQGGAVSFVAPSDDEHGNRRTKRKRKILNTKSSSTASVTPANLHPQTLGNVLHPNPFSEEAGAMSDEPEPQFLPVHTINLDDIRKISKEHLIIAYNGEEEKWELEVVGRIGAFVNNELHSTGNVVALSHNDTISVSTLHLTFKLPDIARPSPGPSKATTLGSEFAEDDALQSAGANAQQASTTPAEGSDDEAEVEDTKARPKLTLKLKKSVPHKDKAQKKPKESEKQSRPSIDEQQQQADLEESPEVIPKPEKGKKPKTAAKEPATTLKQEASPPLAPPPPPVPQNLEPGSIFEGVAAEELPQKRKGPGRPPKNGLISKRDQSFVKRKLKEYEKRGEAPPPMDMLVQIVRAENKAKEAAAKAAQRGEAPPDMSGVVQSIETDVSALQQRPDAVPMADMANKTSNTPMEPMRKSSPNPKRVARSLSPMKPEHDYTEEELKKPTVTYVHILDEVLRAHPEGRADLQEIYDLICKRYPYFKYRTGTAGWQSSVRHNLLQHERFKENGRSGKGRLWAVNYDYPLEKEKKRRPSPPPRPQMPHMQNGQFQPGQMQQYGQPNYNTQYGQPGMNGQPPFNPAPQPGQNTYYSPYAPSQGGPYPHPPGQPGAPPAPHMGQPNDAPHGGTPHYSQPPPQQPPTQQQQPAQPAPHFQAIVDDIMRYRTRYLSRFIPDSEDFKQHDEIFKKCTNHLSDFFHGATDRVEANLESAEERVVFNELKVIFNRYEHLREPPSSRGPTASTTPAADARAANAGAAGQAASRNVVHEAPSGASANGAPPAAPSQADTHPVGGVEAPDGLSAIEQFNASVGNANQPPANAGPPPPPTNPADSTQPSASQMTGTKRAAEGENDEEALKRLRTE